MASLLEAMVHGVNIALINDSQHLGSYWHKITVLELS